MSPPHQAQYFCRRKFLMVNGTHTTLAFMTLLLKTPAANVGNGPIGEYPLVDWDAKNCGDKYYKEIWAWVSTHRSVRHKPVQALRALSMGTHD